MHVEYIWLMLFEYLLMFSVWWFGMSWSTEVIYSASNALICSLFGVASMAAMGLYDNRQRNRYLGVFTRIIVACVFSGAIIVAAAHVGIVSSATPVFIALVLLSLVSLISIDRAIFERYVDGCVLRKRILVLGTGKRARAIEMLRRKSDQRGFKLLGFVPSMGCQHCYVNADKILDVKDVCEYALANNVDEIVMALDDRRHGLPTEELLDCRMSGMSVTEDLDFFERESGLIQLDLIKSSWLINTRGFSNSYYRHLEKRLLDVPGALILTILLMPFMVLTALAIKLECGWRAPVFYRQVRVGRGGRPFTIFKFRSMCSDAEISGKAQWASCNDQRVTKVGRVIRKYRLDETPQLWNVIVGDMSLVGPRPERPEFVDTLEQMNDLYRERHRLAPGLTGWAQLCYPYGASTDDSIEKLKYDLYYVKNHGFFLDLFILLQTAEVVLFKKGAR
tara:strand:- start:107 stop:1453 length:1347 start_codon:yes stop_codon:yes gene_type:complete